MILEEDRLISIDQVVKDEWVAALRNGTIPQGAMYLHNASDGRMCCLGVLSNIAVKHGAAESRVMHRSNVEYGIGDEFTISSLPPVVCEWAGFPDKDLAALGALPFLSRTGHHVSLSYLNDSGFTFSQIADVIDYFY